MHIVKNRKIIIAIGRILSYIFKVIAYFSIAVIAVALSFIVVYFLLKECLEINMNDIHKKLNTIVDGNSSTDLLSFGIAVPSLVLSIVTMFHEHFNREQDRVMNFPESIISYAKILLDNNSILDYTEGYFEKVGNAKALLLFGLGNGFSSYYVAEPYRLFVRLHNNSNNEKDKWEEVIVGSYQMSHINNQEGFGRYEMMIECGESKLLEKYTQKGKYDKSQKAEIILDMVWRNRIIPIYRRSFSNIYIREHILLNSEKGEDDIFSKYVVCYTMHESAPLMSGIIQARCMWTQIRLKKIHMQDMVKG